MKGKASTLWYFKLWKKKKKHPEKKFGLIRKKDFDKEKDLDMENNLDKYCSFEVN